MNVLVSSEHRFDRTPDGAVWTQALYTYSFWTRYLAVFDRVRILARVRDVPDVPADWHRADGASISFAPVPHYLGPRQYALRVRTIRRAVLGAICPRDAVILRLPSPIAAITVPLLRRGGHPYGVEVVGDPYDVFGPGAVRHPLRPFFRWWFPRQMRRQCAAACAAAYVTEYMLQRRYPPGPSALSASYSSVDLPGAAFTPGPKLSPPEMLDYGYSYSDVELSDGADGPAAQSARPRGGVFTLVTVGSLAQMYKAPDVLIDAVALCVRGGLNLRLTLIGDGKYRPELEARAAALGLGERVCFLGQLPAGPAVRAELDRGDLFVLPSRTEGLPRAMIEAMARALPCIGSRVGGIPELLPPEDMTPPGDTAALAAKIREVVTDPVRSARMSARNLERAAVYREEALRALRVAFYRYVRGRTDAWLKERGQE